MKKIKQFNYSHYYESESILIITAFNNEKNKVGHINVVIDEVDDIIRPWVSSALVYTEYRRLGIATAMYDYAENLLNTKIQPAEEQTEDACNFWKSRK